MCWTQREVYKAYSFGVRGCGASSPWWRKRITHVGMRGLNISFIPWNGPSGNIHSGDFREIYTLPQPSERLPYIPSKIYNICSVTCRSTHEIVPPNPVHIYFSLGKMVSHPSSWPINQSASCFLPSFVTRNALAKCCQWHAGRNLNL